MPPLPIRIYGDEVLSRTAIPVERVTDEIRRLAADMIETMYHANGIGIAANQVGSLDRIAIVDVEWARAEDEGRRQGTRNPIVMVNPEVLEESIEDESYDEGCLSLPGITGEVWRPKTIRVRYSTLEGEVVEREATDLFARCIQHEVDHLNGVLFIDRMSKARRLLLVRSLRRLRDSRGEPDSAGESA